MKVSDCCYAPAEIDEYGICPECLEHCDFIDESEPDDESIYNNFNHEGGIRYDNNEWQGR